MLDDPIIKHTVIALVIITGSAILGRLLRLVIDIALRRFIALTKTTLDDRIFNAIESKVMALSIVAGVSLGIREVRKGLTVENITHHQILDYLAIGVFIVFVGVLAHLVSRIIMTTIEWYADRVSIKNRSDLTPTIAPFTSK